MSRATMSRDGELRINLRVPGRASRDELAIVLVRGAAPYHVAGEDREELSGTRARKRLQELLWQHGVEMEGWPDDLEDEDRDEWLAWGRRQVDRAHPALRPQGATG